MGLATRNSPIFWIMLSFFTKYFSYDSIRLLNTLIIFFITIIFYKTLKIKYKSDNTGLIVLSSFLLLSPSLRSLVIWPYSLTYGLFFLLSLSIII